MEDDDLLHTVVFHIQMRLYCSSNDPEPGPGDQIRTERFPFSIASPGLIPDPIRDPRVKVQIRIHEGIEQMLGLKSQRCECVRCERKRQEF